VGPITLEVLPHYAELGGGGCRGGRSLGATQGVVQGVYHTAPISGGGGDLVRTALDLSIWGGPTLTWMSTKGNPYFVLDDTEEREMWAELQAMTRVRVVPTCVRNPLFFAVW
jgi:hypothetical protein